ncbi:MAG: PQQ-binding-like beta-propeller repeat protein [Planctomycetes bacterium]|nr:PQQ-binding-like beta-propeller repeat protein [Planctomycetota bacterium]
MPTAPIAVGDLVFVADRSGQVYAITADGKLRWKAYTGGPIYYPPAFADGRVFVGSADGRVYAFEAATGRLLWSYRVAPGQRRIPVYGKLISTWPVAGGVVVQDGTVYAAAGIAHYDGTYVVALDAVTGKLKWKNDRSGRLAPKSNRGVSLQGNLFIADGELRFLGGGVCEFARFDLKTGRCLNPPKEGVSAQFQTAFYAYYPKYGTYLSLDLTLPDRSLLVYDASYEGSRFSNLARLKPLPPGKRKPPKPASRWLWKRPKRPSPPLWEDRSGRRFTSFIVGPTVLLAAGHEPKDRQATFLVAYDLQSGKEAWHRALPALVVKGGLAVDHRGRVVASLENGAILCLEKR